MTPSFRYDIKILKNIFKVKYNIPKNADIQKKKMKLIRWKTLKNQIIYAENDVI